MLKTPARLARRLQELAALSTQAAPAIARRIDGIVRQDPPMLGTVEVTAAGSEVTVRQARPSPGAPPVKSVLPSTGIPPAWAAAIADETGQAFAKAIGGGS
jgi:hypothetical protein